jgi:ribonuclease T2
MKGPKSNRSAVALAVAVIGALFAWYSQRAAENPPSVRPAAARNAAPFDFYLLALSIHPAFCADGNQGRSECRGGGGRPLAIHGLWPENLDSGAYPHDCPAPRLDLEPALATELAAFMPGMESNLHEHEWRKHGGCSGLGDDEYFRHTLDAARAVDAALGPTLTTLAGRETGARELRAAADRFQAGLGATFTLHCRVLRGAPRREPFLIEVRQCIDNDGTDGGPGTLLDCASVNRRDQGCGRSFRIAESVR